MAAIPEQLDGDLEAAYRAHAPRLYRRARRWLPPDEAEDLVQETFLRAWKHHGGADPGVPWLMTVLRNLAIDRSRRIHPVLTGDPATLDRETPEPGPSETVVAFEDRRRVREALGQLTGSQRTAITLREWGGLSQREIAASLGTTVHSVESLLLRGRRRLRSILDKAMGLVLWPVGGLWRRIRGTPVPETAAPTAHAWVQPMASLATAATVIVAGAALPQGSAPPGPPAGAHLAAPAPGATDGGAVRFAASSQVPAGSSASGGVVVAGSTGGGESTGGSEETSGSPSGSTGGNPVAPDTDPPTEKSGLPTTEGESGEPPAESSDPPATQGDPGGSSNGETGSPETEGGKMQAPDVSLNT